jgi:hypothetical protein
MPVYDSRPFSAKLKGLLTFLVALVLGTLYAGLLGLVTYPLRATLISWPIWIILFCLPLRKFNLVRVSGYLALVPLLIFIFEIARTTRQPPIYAFQLLSLDRSHFTPGARVINRKPTPTDLEITPSSVSETLIGEDGFRADPKTGRGNPPRCQNVLIGDSMIYGSGLSYSDTLRPVLAAMGTDTCVFGVTGNAPVDYLATLDYVKDRIEKGAHIAIYICVYNDFVSLRKYLERSTRRLSAYFIRLTGLINYYDEWRRTTFIQGLLRKATAPPKRPIRPWRLKISETKEIEVYWPYDPSHYRSQPPLDPEQRATFQFFLQRLRELVAYQPWRVSIVFIPDNDEMLANLAHPSSNFQDLDSRRVEALKMCAALWFDCHDLSPYLFKRTIAEGQNPFLLKDRHFSLFGNRVVAEHYTSIAKPNPSATAVAFVTDDQTGQTFRSTRGR